MVVVHSKEFPRIEIKQKRFPFIYFNGRKVGFIKKGIFWKIPLDRKKHVFRKWNSVGIEEEILDYLERVGIHSIAVTFDGVSWYKVPLKIWQDGMVLEYGGVRQRHLTIEDIKRFSETVYYEDWKKSFSLKRWLK